jgi:hypothetical protein
MTTSADKRKGRQPDMHKPPVAPLQAWKAAREQLLVKEKAHICVRDALAAERRRLTWMAVDRAHAFEGLRAGQPARPVRLPASADRLPRLLRAGRSAGPTRRFTQSGNALRNAYQEIAANSAFC